MAGAGIAHGRCKENRLIQAALVPLVPAAVVAVGRFGPVRLLSTNNP